jgi:GNAT superfamily N-acetyltransferase
MSGASRRPDRSPFGPDSAAPSDGSGEAAEPIVIVDPVLTPPMRDRLVDMWARVTNAGGAVGFVPPVSVDDIRPTAERSFARVEAGEDTLVCLAVPEEDVSDGLRIIAWLLLAESESHLRRHWRTVYRVQVDPDWQGSGLGRRLMLEAARIARDKLGMEALTLMTRGGTGAEHFYLRCGYREVGRIPGAIRVAPGDDRDEVHFWLDLGPNAWESAT